ncbi:MAG: rhomboid family intramembrane serine protease [Deinococcota bacterium]|nr:rhomboid family intramembrane serine protease [Deinococcota bacterium]
MTQDTLLFVYALTVMGFFSSRWMLKLAPLRSELAVKTMLATLLAALVALAGAGFVPLTPALAWPFIAVAALYIAGPLVLPALVRARNYRLALGLTGALYWSTESRAAVRRLLAQAALQRADAEAALMLMGEQDDSLLRIQAYALQERWHEVLALAAPDVSGPHSSDNVFLAYGARVWALSELGEVERAEDELEGMRALWQERGQGPLGYRSISLGEARLHAAKGDFEGARHKLQDEGLPGVPPYLALMILGRAAERGQRLEQAGAIYKQAYRVAPEGLRPLIAQRLAAYGPFEPEPQEAAAKVSVATLSLALFLVAAYGLQVWIDGRYGSNVANLVAGFLLNFPGVPESDAPWRFMSYAFVHGGIFHIGFNVWVLYDIGRLYEARRNWGSLVAAFVVGTLAGAYMTLLAQGGDMLVLVGASGGVLGIAGALLADTWNSRNPGDRLLSASLLRWIALLMAFSLLIPQVSLWGHAGGIVGGLLWGFLRQGLARLPWLDRVAGSAGLLVMLVALAMAAQWLVRYS